GFLGDLPWGPPCRPPSMQLLSRRNVSGGQDYIRLRWHNRHAHWIVNPRSHADQPHGSELRLVLPLELHRLEEHPGVLAGHRRCSFFIIQDLTVGVCSRSSNRTDYRASASPSLILDLSL